MVSNLNKLSQNCFFGLILDPFGLFASSLSLRQLVPASSSHRRRFGRLGGRWGSSSRSLESTGLALALLLAPVDLAMLRQQPRK